MGLIDQMLAGNRRALARIISIVEAGGADAAQTSRLLYSRTGRAHRVGVTGPPGAGKSTLVNEIALELRRRDRAIAIVAVDPSSPFTGGAILGDRIRMQPLGNDPAIFMRSMASRGQLGGLARATVDVVNVLDAAGFDLVIVETVGAGQAEVEIVGQAHTTVVVEVPGLGDDIQAIKAGILEIADIFVVNKADRPEATKTQRQLQMMLQLGHPKDLGWQPPILSAIATRGEGIAPIVDAIDEHRRWLVNSGELDAREHERVQRDLRHHLHQVWEARFAEHVPPAELDRAIARIQQGNSDPATAATELLDRVFGKTTDT